MRESQFQLLEHRLGGLSLHSRGETLAVGYSPDLTATQDGVLRLIIENEPRSDLQAIIGGYQRAEKYCRDVNATPSLIIVTAGKGLIGVRVAAARLREYAQFWRSVNPPGSLREVLLMSDSDYAETVRRRIPAMSAAFRELCLIIPLRGVPAAIPELPAQDPVSPRPAAADFSLRA